MDPEQMADRMPEPEPETTTIYGLHGAGPLRVLHYENGTVHIGWPEGGMWLDRRRQLLLLAALTPKER